jgi:hypothetical protein
MHRHLARAASLLHECAGGLSSTELADHAEGKWSAAATIEHLARTYSGTEKGFERVFAKGGPAVERASLITRVTSLLVIDGGYVPTGRQSPALALPTAIDPGEALPLAVENLRMMDDALARAGCAFGIRVPLLDHPVLGPLNVSQWRKFHWSTRVTMPARIVRRTAR